MLKTIPLVHPYLEITPNVLVGNVVIAPRLHEKPFPGVAFYPDGNPIEALVSGNRTTVSRNVKKYMSGNSTENASVKKFDCSVKKFTLLSQFAEGPEGPCLQLEPLLTCSAARRS